VQAIDEEKQELIEKYKYTQTEVEEQRDVISQKDLEIVNQYYTKIYLLY